MWGHPLLKIKTEIKVSKSTLFKLDYNAIQEDIQYFRKTAEIDFVA